MPIETEKEGLKENPFSGKELADKQTKSFKMTLDRKSEGKNIELNFKGPGSREELEKALSEGKMPSGWEVTVSYGKKGKSYVIDDSTLFDNYLKGTKYERASGSGPESTVAGRYSDRPRSGATESEFTVSRPDATKSGSARIAGDVRRDTTKSGASKISGELGRDSPKSGAAPSGFTRSQADKSFSGARKADAQLLKDTTQRETEYAKARGSTVSGAAEAGYSLSQDKPMKGKRVKNAAEEQAGDVSESD